MCSQVFPLYGCCLPKPDPRAYLNLSTKQRGERITLQQLRQSRRLCFPSYFFLHLHLLPHRERMEVEGSRRQSSSLPDFEFCMVSNPSCPPSGLLTADELFFDGVIIPLHLLSLQRSEPPAQVIQDPPIQLATDPSVQLMLDRPPSDPPPPSTSASFSAAPTSGSQRWKGLFKVAGEKKPEEKDKERKERKSSGAAAELNINLNIWPFSRSHSAGNTSAAGIRHRSAASRKVSSAPCSRSNSRGESASAGGVRKWTPSPGRSGVHLGRSTPIWQLRRSGMAHKEKARNSPSAHSATAAGSGGGGGVRLNLKVNNCIGYSKQTSCREDDSNGATAGDRTIEGSGNNGSIFSLRALFSKKVY